MNRYERGKGEKLQNNSEDAEQRLVLQASQLHQQNQLAQAEALYMQILSANPQQPDALHFLGVIKLQTGHTALAIELISQSLKLKPNLEACLNLASAYKYAGNVAEAEKNYHQAIRLDPKFFEAYYNLGCLYQEQCLYNHAETVYLAAIELNPQSLKARTNLAVVNVYQGHLTKALENIRKTFAPDMSGSQADKVTAHSSYIFIMHYDPASTREKIFQETLEWGKHHADPIAHLKHHNDRDPARRLRIGYVSGDFRQHAVIYYLEPVLKSHDKSQVEIFCYANQARGDAVTARLQSYADHWRDIFRISDKAAAQLIQEDKIDILIDLSGHTEGNRLLIFAYKPAPIQATWIGYFNTTGVKAINYIITDRFLLPPGEEHLYVEKPWRLPGNSTVFAMHDLPVAVNALPALTNGYITFGCFNALPKLTPEVIELWVGILKRLPNGQLILKNRSFSNVATCAQYREQFAALGIDSARLKFSGNSPLPEYLQAYNDVDIGLDPFPYHGGITTLDSLWMGVPVIAMKGNRMGEHMGDSLLRTVGLEECIVSTKTEYVEKAVTLANKLQHLAEIRRTLRPTLTAAPFTNPILFTHGLETAFRNMWKQWCTTK